MFGVFMIRPSPQLAKYVRHVFQVFNYFLHDHNVERLRREWPLFVEIRPDAGNSLNLEGGRVVIRSSHLEAEFAVTGG